MAFNVTPTSGEAPYELTAVIDDSVNIDGVHYVASLLASTNAGTCPAPGSGSVLDPNIVSSLIADGSVVFSTVSTPPGQCRTVTLNLTRLSDNVVIDSSSVSINNL